MIYRKFYKRWLVVLAGIAFLISSMQGVVLCIAGDDHVALELTSSGCYDSFDTNISSEEPMPSFKEAFSSSKDNCGPCVDIPISVHLAGVSKKPNLVNPSLRVSPTITPATISSCDFSKYQLGPELFATLNPTLASLRTIILLT